MSWFDATGLANIAKTALKEAQKTIDKALDIRDEDNNEEVVSHQKSECYGAGSSYRGPLKDENEISSTTNKSKEEMVKENTVPNRKWGSFSESFFQVDKCATDEKKSLYISTQPHKSPVLLHPEEDTLPNLNTDFSPTDCNKKNSDGNNAKKCDGDNSGKDISIVHNSGSQNKQVDDVSSNSVEDKVITRTKRRQNSSNRNSYVLNRLSVLSSESEGKKSSESVEVLGSLSCTTSPDTDLPSISASSSMGLPVSSSCTDSVEVIDSLTSPSSIEVMLEGTGSDRTLHTSSKDDSMANRNSGAVQVVSSPISCLNDVSPESFEVIPDLPEFDEELSIADSYTSASESTGPTVLEPSCQYSYRMTESFTDLSQASSKFRSGDSTPDVTTKLPSTHRNSCDVLVASVHEIPGTDFLESNRSSETKKQLFDYEKSAQKSLTPEDVQDTSPDTRSRTERTSHESPTKRPLIKLDDRNFRNIFDDIKCSKLDLVKTDLSKSIGLKAEFEDGGGQEVEKIDVSSDEICGSGSSYSDSRTVIANDSSCDEIILESSSEDAGNILEPQGSANYRAEKSAHEEGHNHSCYVKNLLTEAIGEVSTTRETSPTLSEKSRSDLVKVGSEQTSGHTSGDELETTTSSDIEIISRYSPNGDSSSTTSRHSPAKHFHNNAKSKLSLVAVDILGRVTQSKIKGHQREPSETSSFCSEDNSSEVEKLSKRVTELTEILEARESRLNDLRKANLEMQEKTQELRKEMEQAKVGMSALQSESEKDKLIKELKEEGEKLSKKELKQSTLIKTLRAQEKSQQAMIESSRIQIQSLTKSVEELKAELSVKRESEKVLSESVKQMNKKITRQDEEIANLINEMEKAVIKAEGLKILLDTRETELKNCQELLAAGDFELQDSKAVAELKTKQLERLKIFQENAEIELEDLRQQLKKSEERHFEHEKSSREEKNKLMRRLQEAEARNEELAQSVSKATRPLLRQMEVLQAATTHERETWEKQEKNLLQKLEEAESRLSSVLYHEKSSKQEILDFQTKVNNLEEQLKTSNQELDTWKNQVTSLNKQLEDLKGTFDSDRLSWEKAREAFESQILDLKGEIARLEHELSSERANVEIERRKAAALQDHPKEKECQAINRDSSSPRSSPTLSFGRASLSESISSNAWPQFQEDAFDSASVSGRYTTVYDNLRAGNTTSLIESLQAQLKMRDGEISQLQWELQRRDTERVALTSEISTLTSKLEEQENKLAEMGTTTKSLKELQTSYDALLEMYGEKVEEAEELRLDLQDVKDMYKAQIEELLKKERQQHTSDNFYLTQQLAPSQGNSFLNRTSDY